MKFAKTLLLLFIFSIGVKAQNAPATDIYLYDLKEKKGKITLSKGKNLTNRAKYDNQPYFYNPDYLIYTSEMDDGQMDIIGMDLYNGKTRNLTNSAESEYSAHMIPGYDSFASVRVEADGTQRLWLFHMRGKKQPELVFDDLAPVGYHAWSGTNVAMFILGDPVTLVLTDSKSRNDQKVTDNIGRTIKWIPGTQFIAFERTKDNESAIYQLNPADGRFEKVIDKPENASDWAITMEGTYLISTGTKIWKYNPKSDKSWQEVMDLGDMASKGITRMAVSPENDRIAIVIGR